MISDDDDDNDAVVFSGMLVTGQIDSGISFNFLSRNIRQAHNTVHSISPLTNKI